MNRRKMMLGTVAAGLAGGVWALPLRAATFEVTMTEAQWRAKLSPLAYAVLREEDTERAGSSPLDKETRAGTYHCGGCDLPVFGAQTKYDSGTGWPSFWQPLAGAIGTKDDPGLFGSRTEVHCRRCGGHLGHVFDDGPQPTGLRYCLNGAALVFRAG